VFHAEVPDGGGPLATLHLEAVGVVEEPPWRAEPTDVDAKWLKRHGCPGRRAGARPWVARPPATPAVSRAWRQRRSDLASDLPSVGSPFRGHPPPSPTLARGEAQSIRSEPRATSRRWTTRTSSLPLHPRAVAPENWPSKPHFPRRPPRGGGHEAHFCANDGPSRRASRSTPSRFSIGRPSRALARACA
jgi:hypothetical protein